MNHKSRIIVGCCGAHAIQDGLVALQYVVLPILAQSFGLSYSEVGLLRAIGNVSMSALEVPAGLLVGRYGERRLLSFGLVVAGAGYVGVATASSFSTIAIGFLIAGVGAAFQHALATSTITTAFHGSSRRRVLGYYNSAGDAGKLSFTGLFGLLVGVGISWNFIVVMLCLVTFVFAAFVWRSLRVDAVAPSADDARVLELPIASTGRWGIRDEKGFRSIALIVCLDCAVQAAFLTFIAFVLLEKGATTSLASSAVVITLAGGMVGKFGAGLAAARLGDRLAFVFIQLLSGVALVAIIALPAVAVLYLLPFAGLVIQGSSTIAYGAVADFLDPVRTSRGYALIYALGSLATVIGTLLFGFLADYQSPSMSLLALVFVTALTVALSGILRTTHVVAERVASPRETE